MILKTIAISMWALLGALSVRWDLSFYQFVVLTMLTVWGFDLWRRGDERHGTE